MQQMRLPVGTFLIAVLITVTWPSTGPIPCDRTVQSTSTCIVTDADGAGTVDRDQAKKIVSTVQLCQARSRGKDMPKEST